MTGHAPLRQSNAPVDKSVRRVNMAQLGLFEDLKRAQERVVEVQAQLVAAVTERDEVMRAALGAGHSIRSITDITGLGVGTVHNVRKKVVK